MKLKTTLLHVQTFLEYHSKYFHYLPLLPFFVRGSVANPSSSRKKEADLIRGQKKLIFISNEGEAQEEERRTYALFKALSALAIRET